LSTPETPVSPSWKEGDVIIGLYDVRGIAGTGNFGTVYRVHHPGWRRDLAVKSPSQGTLANDHYVKAYLDGARRWTDLGLHPNIVTCFYVRDVDGVPHVFAEYAPGGSLRDKLADEIDLETALDHALQISAAMAHAHGRGVVHGNLKPENCLFTREGSLKVADFGLGSIEEFSGDASNWLRALRYVAPERWALTSGPTPRADIFSFGAILHALQVTAMGRRRPRATTSPILARRPPVTRRRPLCC
jgi:serine/threonine protein kinase